MHLSNRSSILGAALLLGAALAFGPAPAHATSASYGIRSGFFIPSGANTCASTVDVNLRVKNIDSNAVDLDDVTLLPIPVLSHDGSQAPTTAPTRLSFAQGVDLPVLDVVPGEEITLPMKLSKPTQDGYYREDVEIAWLYDSAATKEAGDHTPRGLLYYRVDGGCVSVVSSSAYHTATDLTTTYSTRQNGQSVQVTDVEGYDAYGTQSAGESSAAQPLFMVTSSNMSQFNDDPAQRAAGRASTVTTLEYCVKVRYDDDFDDCPSNTDAMLWWRPYCDNDMTPMLGLIVELWDYDSSTDDDLIGTYGLYYSARGNYTCMSFDWDSTARGETWPDPYIKTSFKVMDTEFSTTERAYLCEMDQSATTDTCTDFYGYTWRSSYYSNQSGKIYEAKYFGSASDVSNQRAMSMAAVQKVLRSFQGNYMTGDLNVWWDGSQCTQYGAPWPCSYDDNWFTMAEQTYQRWDVGPHEAGHNYQKQLFEQTSLTGDSCPSPHYVDSAANETCATREGWANFLSALTWYTDTSDKDIAKPKYLGEKIENGANEYSACSDNADTEIQETRAFWDLYDSRSDGGDTSSVSQTRWDILYTWDRFADGTSNQQDREAGSNGVNMRDYHANASWDSDVQNDAWDAMEENEVDCQDAN